MRLGDYLRPRLARLRGMPGLRWETLKTELLFGSWQRKKDYVETVLNLLRGRPSPPSTAETEPFDFSLLVEGVQSIRTGVDFSKVMIFPATVDYRYMKQRPQQLAHAFARSGFLVIYGTTNFQRDRVKVLERADERLYLLNDTYYPYLHHVFAPKETVYYCMWPNNAKYLPHVKHAVLLYDYMDQLSLLNLPQDELQRQHEALMDRADWITVSADRLFQQIPERHRGKTLLINNAVEQSFLDRTATEPADTQLRGRFPSKAVIGYFGAMAEWFDFELVEKVARDYIDQAVFIFIGPVIQVERQLSILQESCSNVHAYPMLQHDELPPVLNAFDVCIIPFLKNDITDAVSPVKLFEYMGAGKPVVTTDLHECSKYPEVLVGATAACFSARLRDALARRENAAYRDELRAVACANTWEARVERIIYAMNEKPQ